MADGKPVESILAYFYSYFESLTPLAVSMSCYSHDLPAFGNLQGRINAEGD